MPLHVFFGSPNNRPFKEWLHNHSEVGFYLNVKSKHAAMVHRASCTHVASQTLPELEVTENMKVAGTSIEELDAFAAALGISLARCLTCLKEDQ